MNQIHNILDPWVASAPDNSALVDPVGRQWTYAEIFEAVGAAEAVLRDHGAVAGDRIVVVTENSACTIAFAFAASRVGAWLVPVNARMTLAEVTRVLDHARPRVVILTVEASETAIATADALGAVDIEGAFGYVAVVCPFESSPEPMTGGSENVATLLYTTGTTGAPKGVMLTHANLFHACRSSAVQRDLDQHDIVYLALPMSHVFGLITVMFTTFSVGGSLRLENRFTPTGLFRALREGVTCLPAVPQMHANLMKYARDNGVPKLQGTKLRFVSSGAAPLDLTWKREAEAFYGLALQNGYGMTETAAGICATKCAMGDPDISVGHPYPRVEVRLARAGDDDIGEIQLRAPNVMKGYYKMPAETARVLSEDGWFSTGDLGRIDEYGRLHIAGRSKELIIRSGFNVFPLEVEAAINSHSDVIQTAVVGRRIEGGNEEVLAFAQVVPSSTITEIDLKAHAAAVLINYKRPTRIVVTQSLPVASTGKVLKNKLVTYFSAELEI